VIQGKRKRGGNVEKCRKGKVNGKDLQQSGEERKKKE
jgi:hypothetical protein